MPTGSTETQPPKEAILQKDTLLKEKLTMLEKKLMRIRDELLGASPTGEDKAPKPEPAGFLAEIQDRLHENCVKVDEMNGIANEVMGSLISDTKITP